MRSLTAASLLLCATVLSPASARQGSERSASVHLLGPRSSSASSTQHSGSQQANIVNSAASSSTPSSYSPSDANALISSFLRIEEYEVLRDGLEVPHQLTLQPFEDNGGETATTSAPLMVLTEDMTSYGINGLFPSLDAEDGPLASRLVHSFKVDSTPGPRAWMELLDTYRSRIAEKFGLTLKNGETAADKEKRMMLPPMPGSLGANMALGPELLDVVSTSLLECATLYYNVYLRLLLSGVCLLRQVVAKSGSTAGWRSRSRERACHTAQGTPRHRHQVWLGLGRIEESARDASHHCRGESLPNTQ